MLYRVHDWNVPLLLTLNLSWDPELSQVLGMALGLWSRLVTKRFCSHLAMLFSLVQTRGHLSAQRHWPHPGFSAVNASFGFPKAPHLLKVWVKWFLTQRP